MRSRARKITVASAALLLTPSIALAGDLLARDAFSGVVVMGAAAASGEASWVDGGQGKLQTGGDEAQIAGNAILAWRGRFSQWFGAVVTADLQSRAIHPVGLDEAYLTLRPDPQGAIRLSGRAGLFFPPVSPEHDGTEWSVVRTLTPSAINSWIAEEVKVAGVEITARATLAGQPAGLTLSAFQGDDTSGALLTFRGWALHDLRSNLGGEFRLPPSSGLFAGMQARKTRSIDEVDGRWGVYAQLDYAPSDRLSLTLFGYDNGGDRVTVTGGQYAWRTRFVQAAAHWTPRPNTEVLAQVVTGETGMGTPIAGIQPANIGFAAAYVLVSQTTAHGMVTARLDQFSVADRSFKAIDNNAEHGWAATAAWALPVSTRAQIVLEAVVIDSFRRDRVRLGGRPRQSSLQGRTAYRIAF